MRLMTFSALALSACMPVSGRDAALAGGDQCGAAVLQDYVGKPVESYDFQANHEMVRIVPHGAAVTMDHWPERLNVLIGDDGLIARIWCG